LNTAYEFRFVGEKLPSKAISIDVPADIRIKHTSDLKEAIKNWKNFVPKPTCESDSDEVLEDIKTSENHLLFTDLRNHLHLLYSDICTKWKDYKDELRNFGEMKRALLDAIRGEILKRFKGLDPRFFSDEDHDYELRDFESVPLHFYVYAKSWLWHNQAMKIIGQVMIDIRRHWIDMKTTR
jgi:hypothetical protein